jgi:hypothetical protein
MKPTIALGVALGAATAIATPAAAQYGQPIGQLPASSQTQKGEPSKPAQPKLKLSKGAQAAIIEFQKAVESKDAAAIAAKLGPAQAVAKTVDDRYAVAFLQYTAARNANDPAAKAAGIEALIASGHPSIQAQLATATLELGSAYKAANQPDRAAL